MQIEKDNQTIFCTITVNSDEVDYEARIARMINRYSGIQGRTRTDEEREPNNEIITSRVRNELDLKNEGNSTISKNDTENNKSLDINPDTPQWTSLNAKDNEILKTTKKDEEKRLKSEKFVTGNQCKITPSVKRLIS